MKYDLAEWRASRRALDEEIGTVHLRDEADVQRAHVEIGRALFDLARAAERGEPASVNVRGVIFEVS